MEQSLPFSKKTNVNYLISGYSRDLIGKLSNNKYLPLSIVDVIKYYYPKLNGYKFQWSITAQETIQQIIDASVQSSKHTFDSDVFDCGLSNKFFLQIQPNTNSSQFSSSNANQAEVDWNATPPPHQMGGYRTRHTARRTNNTNPNAALPQTGYRNVITSETPMDENKPSLTRAAQKQSNIILNLMLFPLPPKYKYVIFQCELYFHELHMQYSTIWSIKNPSVKQQHQSGFYGGHSYSNRDYEEEKKDDNTYTKFGWVIHYNLAGYLREHSAMTFECNINVLKVIPEGYPSIKRMQPYPYYDDDFNQNKKSNVSTELYSYESLYDIQLNEKLRFVWNISNTKGMIDRLRTHSEYKGVVQYHSDIFYDMFQLKVSREFDLNHFMISIAGLPRNTTKMGVKIELFAMYPSDDDTLDDNRMKIMSSIITFSYTSPTFVLSKNKNELLMDLLETYKKLSLLCNAIIIQKYDEENNTVCDQMKPIFEDKSEKEPQEDIKEENEEIVIDETKEEEDDTIDMQVIREQILASKQKIIKLSFDTFIWHITAHSDNNLLRKLKCSITKKQTETFTSDIFALLGHKWYISIHTKDTEEQYSHRRSRRSRNVQSNDDKPSVNICLNCLTKGCIDCKVCYHLLQSGARAEFYDSFDGSSFRHRSWGSHSDARSVLSLNANAVKSLCTNEITIKVDISIISESSLSHKKREDKIEDEEEACIKQEVTEWLTDTVHLPQYLDVFKREAIEDLDIVQRITMDTLNVMGITKVGHQLKILHQIDILKQEST